MRNQIDGKTRITYGLGNASNGIKESAFSVFLIFYYTQVVGISASLAGFAVLCSLVVDAISDPLIGHWSDRLRSRWGRRHPFMYASVVPLSLSFYFLFSPPEGIDSQFGFAWLLVFAVSVRLWISFYSIPSNAMIAEMTSNYHERTKLVSLRGLFSWGAGIGMSFLAYSFLFNATADYPDGRLNPTAYEIYGFIGALALILSIVISSVGTHHLIPMLKERVPKEQTSLGFFAEFRSIFKTSAFRILFLAMLIGSVTNGVLDTLRLFINTYFWGFTSDQLSILLIGSVVGLVVAFTGIKFFSERIEKKPLAIIFMIVTVISYTLPILLRLIGWMPENGTNALLVLIVLATAASAIGGFGVAALGASMLADVVDIHHLHSGSRLEGMHFSSFTFSAKATTGIGGFVAGIALDVIQFPTKAEPGTVSEATIFALGGMNALIIGVTLCISLLILLRYPIDKKQHSDVVASLYPEKQPSL